MLDTMIKWFQIILRVIIVDNKYQDVVKITEFEC